jgi:hypothetical protein
MESNSSADFEVRFSHRSFCDYVGLTILFSATRCETV